MQEERQLASVQRDSLKDYQNSEFEASLEADREKQLRKDQEQEQKEEEERKREEDAELERAIAMSLEQARRSEAQAIPEEPAVGSAGCVTLQFKCPASNLKRRFPPNTAFRHVLAYLRNQQSLNDTRWLVQTVFPKRTLGKEESEMTCEELGLAPRSSLLVRDIDV